MNILCVTHADFETPGVIQDWAFSNHFSFQIVKPYQGEKLPCVDEYNFIVIMGGPQSPLEIEQFPYLKKEIALISDAIRQNKKILGFCLGAQLIGEALGAKTTKSPEKEVGVYPIRLTEHGTIHPLFKGFYPTFDVIHWHNDMPGLTQESVVLASSAGCPRQIIQYAEAIYGFQCHLEITIDGIRELINCVPNDLKPSRFTQSQNELLNQDYTSINKKMVTILDTMVAL
jgi:GMP synthase (glutamine-hydrolysing)